jgi:DNA polymerase elongation subunit (family B)
MADRDDSEGEYEPAEEAQEETGEDADFVAPEVGRGGVELLYDGGDYLAGVPTREALAEKGEGKQAGADLAGALGRGQPVAFMPTSIEETHVYEAGGPVYVISMYGPMRDGTKGFVTITGIQVYFDVEVPAAAPADFEAKLRRRIEPVAPGARVETVWAYRSKGYQTAPCEWRRVTTRTTKERQAAIEVVREAGYATASDDRSSHYRKTAREKGLALCGWCELANYEYARGPTPASPLASHMFRVDVSCVRPLAPSAADRAQRARDAAAIASDPLLSHDRTLVVCWDIETYSSRKKGDLPVASQDGDWAFMLALTAHWKDDPAPLVQVCIADVPIAPDPAWTTVTCRRPADVLRAFALCWRALAPDVVAGFNDGDYDWPFVVEKARKYDVLGWMFDRMTAAPRKGGSTSDGVMQWQLKSEFVKISGAGCAMPVSYLAVPGVVSLDVRVCYRKIFAKSEASKASSLKFYLEAVGLPGKADMPIREMWRRYESALAAQNNPAESASAQAALSPAQSALSPAQSALSPAQGALSPAQAAKNAMHAVAHYCVVDAARCQALLVRRGIINDYREVGALAYVSLADVHFRAGGVKVCNLLGAYAARSNILTSMIPARVASEGKYPGAYVYAPEKGLVPDPGRLQAFEDAAARARDARAACVTAACDEQTAKNTSGAGRALGDTERALGGAERALDDAERELAGAREALAPDRPVTGLDFSSLYPSIIMAYNLSPEKIILDPAEAERVAQSGETLHAIEFPYGGVQVRGWSVRHNNKPEAIGLYPSVLIDLFARRAEMKQTLGQLAAAREALELVAARAGHGGGAAAIAAAARELCAAARDEAERANKEAAAAPTAEARADAARRAGSAAARHKTLAPVVYEPAAQPDASSAARSDESAAQEYARVKSRTEFDWGCANAKQGALKVYMNTFYGETGNATSPFFLLQLAGGVTSAGQYNIKMVADFVQAKGFRLKYGDTDSLYLCAGTSSFAACDEGYAAGRLTREQWMDAQVRITIRALNQLRDEVNAYLAADNGTPYLKMAYEEVLYPVMFAGKKKYYGVPHLNEVNFHPEELFIRGIDVVKQGQPEFARSIGYAVMWASTSVANREPIRAIVQRYLAEAVAGRAPDGRPWVFGDFVKSDAWKPDKNNVPVQRFIARMKARLATNPPRGDLYLMPDAGERFKYVIVRAGAAFELKGTLAHPKKGDLMEFANVAEALKLEVDVSFYMINYVVGLCARFVNCDRSFAVKAADDAESDKLSQKVAKNALVDYVRGLAGNSKSERARMGHAFRRAFKLAVADAADSLPDSARFNLLGPYLSGVFSPALGFTLAPAKSAGAARDDGNDDGDGLDGDNLDGDGLDGAQIADDAGDTLGDLTGVVHAAWAAADSLAAAADFEPYCEALAKAKGLPADTALLFRLTAAPASRRHVPVAVSASAAAWDRRETAVRAALVALAPAALAAARRFGDTVSAETMRYRAAAYSAGDLGPLPPDLLAAGHLAPAPPLPDADCDALDSFRNAWLGAVGVQLARRRHASFTAYLRRLKSRCVGAPPEPPGARANIRLAASRLPPQGIVVEL